MAIIQISKIQQRSGNIVDLPQLDEAEFGWATDVKRLYIGKTIPNENIEVLTSYSNISFSQINGAFGNLEIDGANVANGQALIYTGSEWTNRGGDVGGLINLGDVSNVKIGGGALSYVLETDGTGNLSWAPKSTIIAYIENVTNDTTGVVTTTTDNYFVDGSEITITNVPGMTELNGNTYYADVLTSNTFALYSDSGLTIPVDTSVYGVFPYTAVTATDSLTNQITVANVDAFTVNDPVIFLGSIGDLVQGTTYYVLDTDTGNTPGVWMTVSDTIGGNEFPLTNDTGSLDVYVPGGRIVSLVNSTSGSGSAGGTNTMVQFNNTNLLTGSSDFTFDFGTTPKILTLNGNANVGNLNATAIVTASRFVSNVTVGTAPFTVTSTTRVANLNVANANVADYAGNVTVAAQGNITSVGILTQLDVNAVVNAKSFTSNIATGTAPFTVTSTTRVANLNVATANLADYANIVTGSSQSNITSVGNLTKLDVNAVVNAKSFSSNIATGNAPFVVLSTTQVANLNAALAGSVTTNAQSNITSVGILTQLDVNAAVNAKSFTSNVATGTAPFVVLSTTTVANLSAATAGTAGTVTTNAQSNITSVGILTQLDVNAAVNAKSFTSNVATGTAPFTVLSTTRVTNLNVSYANVSDYEVVTAQTTGTYYPALISGTSTGNYALASNANLAFNATTGNLQTTILYATGNITGSNLNTGGVVRATGNIVGANLVSISNVGANFNIIGSTQTTLDTIGGNIVITSGAGNGTGIGGGLYLNAGSGVNSNGGLITMAAGAAAGTDKTGGNVTISSGAGTGAGAASTIAIQTPTATTSGTTSQTLANRITINSTTVNVTTSTNSTSTGSGGLVVVGGVGVGGNIFVGGNANITSTAAATSATSGALIVGGGAGISGNLYVGTNTIVTGNVGVGVSTPAAALHLKAGTATANTAPLKFTSGTFLTTVEAGTTEYDGNGQYFTIDTTTGRGLVPTTQIYRLLANSAAIGPTSALFFGTNSSIPLVANGVYEIEIMCYFVKNNAATLTWTLTNSTTVTSMNATLDMSAITGISTFGSPLSVGVTSQTTAAVTFPVTGSLTAGATHYAKFTILLENASSTNLRLSVLNGSGTGGTNTITPLRGSYWKATRLPSNNISTYVA